MRTSRCQLVSVVSNRQVILTGATRSCHGFSFTEVIRTSAAAGTCSCKGGANDVVVIGAVGSAGPGQEAVVVPDPGVHESVTPCGPVADEPGAIRAAAVAPVQPDLRARRSLDPALHTSRVRSGVQVMPATLSFTVETASTGPYLYARPLECRSRRAPVPSRAPEPAMRRPGSRRRGWPSPRRFSKPSTVMPSFLLVARPQTEPSGRKICAGVGGGQAIRRSSKAGRARPLSQPPGTRRPTTPVQLHRITRRAQPARPDDVRSCR